MIKKDKIVGVSLILVSVFFYYMAEYIYNNLFIGAGDEGAILYVVIGIIGFWITLLFGFLFLFCEKPGLEDINGKTAYQEKSICIICHQISDIRTMRYDEMLEWWVHKTDCSHRNTKK